MRRYEKFTIGSIAAGLVAVIAVLVLVHQLHVHSLVKRAITAEFYCAASSCYDASN